nr:glycosyltransferase family 2 protein [Pedobacter panaciterrae]
MTNQHFSFIILTFNEELHLPRLLESISSLNALTYVLDSGSTDTTLEICAAYNVETKIHPFENHPKQWAIALNSFEIITPWIIGLDADQIVTPELLILLEHFKNNDYLNTDGIYFNRKNYFKGCWIKHGGYYPKYLLKMFRYNIGYSDLTENMDHRFQVPGKTIVWKDGHLIEENLKENNIHFWIEKHNKYSDLLANEEIQRKSKQLKQSISANPFGSPNQRNAFLKKIWWLMPGYFRPTIYFMYRLIFRLGFLDGKNGIIYHFLQGFWFRLIVDIKIEELSKPRKSNTSYRFLINFLILFVLFYGFNIFYIGATTRGGFYLPFLNQHLNYIAAWQQFCIATSAQILKNLGYTVQINNTGLSVENHSGFRLIYSCLGYGIMSCFAAFVIAYPKALHAKLIFLIFGLVVIQLLNTIRFVLISIYYKSSFHVLNIDHHTIFNSVLYAILIIMCYFWLNHPSRKLTS